MSNLMPQDLNLNLWERIQLAKIWFKTMVLSKDEFIVALGHLHEEAKARQEARHDAA